MPDPDQQTSTELAEHEGSGPLAQAEALYSQEERQAMAKFLNIGATDSALVPFLAMAEQLDLSPFHGEIWLIKGRRKDAESGQYVDFYRPTVGRDGLLKHARTKHKDSYGGLRFGVVCANDTFEVEDDGYEIKVLHRMASLRPDLVGEHESRWRGKILGAWAKLYFKDGQPPMYYFAPAHEHVKVEDKVVDGDKKRILAGAWSYTSTMIIKSAVSYVLRIGFGVTGIVPFDELRVDDPQMTGAPAGDDTFAAAQGDAGALDEDPNPKNAAFIAELDLSEDLRGELTIALEQVNEIAPFSWTPAKVRMRLGSDCDEEKGRAVLAEVEGEYKALREREAERLKREADQAREEEAIQIVLARDVKVPIELHVVEGEEEPYWALVEDVLFDEPAGVMVLKLSGSRERNFKPTAELEVRTPVGEDASTDEG